MNVSVTLIQESGLLSSIIDEEKGAVIKTVLMNWNLIT